MKAYKPRASMYWDSYAPNSKPACKGELSLAQAYARGKASARVSYDLTGCEARFDAKHCRCAPGQDCAIQVAWYVGWMDVVAN